MNAVESAERRSRARALTFYLFAAVLVVVLAIGLARPQASSADFMRGFWVGISIVAVLSLLPWGRWLRPDAPLTRLLDDEGVRENRRSACTAGFWAAMAATLGTTMIPQLFEPAQWPFSAFDTARLIATAAIVAAFATFATLELRGSRD